jgi:hypothetical protein
MATNTEAFASVDATPEDWSVPISNVLRLQ